MATAEQVPTTLGRVMLAGQVMVGIGFTITVAVIGVPAQPLADGVMVKVTVTGTVVVLFNIPLIFPVPLAAIPGAVAVLFLVQA